MSDEEFLHFSEENNPFRIEREPNGEILYDSNGLWGWIDQSTGLAGIANWADQDERGLTFDSSTDFKLTGMLDLGKGDHAHRRQHSASHKVRRR